MSSDNAAMNDFSSLGAIVEFKFNEKTYAIPPISKKKAKELFKLSRVIDKQTKKEEGKEKDYTEEDIDALDKFQIDYITKAMPDVTAEEIDEWPSALVGKVMELIGKVISGDLSKEKKV